jgi:hypothetical protein
LKNDIGHFSPGDELRKDIAQLKSTPPGPVGYTLFPDDTIVQPIVVSLSKDELKRATEIVPAIYPRILGAVSYRMSYDDESHQTGFIVEVRRNDTPRPITIEKNRWPAAIFIDEGDVPATDVRLFRSSIDGGYAD